MNKPFHIPVLLKEAVEFLRIKEGKQYIDATLGGGGHSFEILSRGGNVLGIEVDQDAVDFVQNYRDTRHETPASQRGERDKWERLRIVKGNFKDIEDIAIANGFEKVDGILFDLGVSSHQLDTPERGFSFGKSGPLDMRMDKNLSVTAKDLVNALGKGELYELFLKLGQEYRARAISESIVSVRRLEKIETTRQLAQIIKKSSKSIGKIHPATKVFQALRIAVNDELNNLRDALTSSVNLLNSKGRLAVISFHSIEDRIAKQQFKDFEVGGIGRVITKKPVMPTAKEIENNARSRSAKLRVFEKN